MFGTKWRCEHCGQKIKVNKPDEAVVETPPKEVPQIVVRSKPQPVSSAKGNKEVKPAASSRRASARRAARQPAGEGEQQQPEVMAVSDNQAVFIIGGFVAVMIIFGVFIFSRGSKKTSRPTRQSQSSQSETSEISRLRDSVTDRPDDHTLRRALALMLMEQGKLRSEFTEALRHFRYLIEKNKGDAQIYTKGVECALMLEDYLTASEINDKAKSYHGGVEDAHRLFAKHERSTGMDKRRAYEHEGMKAAMGSLKEGIICYKKGQNDNELFNVAKGHLQKALVVFEEVQAIDPYNMWLEIQMESANTNLMWSNKMYRNLSDADRDMWKDDK